jgi:hypothetical protein
MKPSTRIHLFEAAWLSMASSAATLAIIILLAKMFAPGQ